MGTGLLEPGGHRDRAAGAGGAHEEGAAGAWGMWGHGDGAAGAQGRRGQGCRRPRDMGTGLLEPGIHGETGTGLLEPRGHGDKAAGAMGMELPEPWRATVPCHPRGQGGCPGGHRLLLPRPATRSPRAKRVPRGPPRPPAEEASPSPAGAALTPAGPPAAGLPWRWPAPAVPRVPSPALGSSPPAPAAPGSQARAERSYFPAGPKAHKRKGNGMGMAGGDRGRRGDGDGEWMGTASGWGQWGDMAAHPPAAAPHPGDAG